MRRYSVGAQADYSHYCQAVVRGEAWYDKLLPSDCEERPTQYGAQGASQSAPGFGPRAWCSARRARFELSRVGVFTLPEFGQGQTVGTSAQLPGSGRSVGHSVPRRGVERHNDAATAPETRC